MLVGVFALLACNNQIYIYTWHVIVHFERVTFIELGSFLYTYTYIPTFLIFISVVKQPSLSLKYIQSPFLTRMEDNDQYRLYLPCVRRAGRINPL